MTDAQRRAMTAARVTEAARRWSWWHQWLWRACFEARVLEVILRDERA